MGSVSADWFCAKAARFCLPVRVPARATLLAVLSLLFLVTSKASQITNGESSNPETQTAPLPSQIVRYEGRTETVSIPVVTERWSATAVPTVPPQQKVIRFVGRFPGFEASKRDANFRTHATTLTRAFARNVAPLAPSAPLSQSLIFEGPNESDTPFVPPNPNLAAGPNYIVVLINSLIAIYDKAGGLQGGFNDLPTFFASLGVTGEVYDPRVIYDQNDNRFIMSFTNVDLSNPTFGNVLIAVSQTSDPTGNWYKFKLDSKGFNFADNAATFPDFPNLGLSTSAIYISNGQFELNSSCLRYGGCSFSDTWIRVIGLPELLSGGANLKITTFTGVRTVTGFPAFAIEPTLTYGSSSEEFLVGAEFSANPGTTLNVFAINTAGTPTLSTANLKVPGFAIPAEADQPNSTIETGDFRLLNAVASNGILWCAQNSGNNEGVGTVGRWYAISIPSLAGRALSQTGTVSGSGSAYFPAVAAKPNGDVVVSFTTSSAGQFASAAFTGRGASDPAGTMRGYSIYRQGTASYNDFAFRWGDYNGAAVDPDGNSVWIIVEYAGSPNPHFGTAVAQVSQPPLLTPSTLSLSFGDQAVTVTSAPQSVTIANVSGTSVDMGTVSLGGANASDFAVSADNCSGSTLPAGGTCTISITFTPSTTGPRNAVLTINSNPPIFPLMVFLTGNGIPLIGTLVVSPSTLNFPDTPARTASTPQTATVSNRGAAPFSVSVSNYTTAFSVVNNCLSPIAPGGSCTLEVTFRPLSINSWTGAIRIIAAAATQGVDINVSGNGVAAPAATLCPATVSFGNQNVGSASDPRTVTMNNVGSSNLTVTQITIAGDFAQANTCGGPGSNLPALTACTINVTFTPTTTGVRSGTLTITDNSAGSPHKVSLTGTGVATSGALLPATAPLDSLPFSPAQSALVRSAHGPHAQAKEQLRKAYAQIPLSFEANLGQLDPSVKFLARGNGYSLFLTAQDAVLTLQKPTAHLPSPIDRGRWADASKSPTPNSESRNPAILRMKVAGANPGARVSGLEELPGRTHYFRGRDPQKWHTNIANYVRVRYQAIYSGVDLVYYGHDRQLKYDFVVQPGADPRVIRLVLDGPTGAEGLAPLRVERNGDLLLVLNDGEVRFHRPVVYQLTSGGGTSSPARQESEAQNRRFLEGRYVLISRNEVRFEVPSYNRSQPLVIDPVLSYSTYLGGSAQDIALGIAVDSTGEAYIVGGTSSADFPAANALQPALNQNLPYSGNVFITKLGADGSSFLFSTFLGGSNEDAGRAITLDSSGNIYIAGNTGSTDFPVTQGALQTNFKTGNNAYPDHAFVTKLSADGSALIYSTLLGGTGQDQAYGIGVDASGNGYVTGVTTSQDFPTTPSAVQKVFTASTSSCGLQVCASGFVAALNAQGSALLYSTFLGGTGYDFPQAIAVDAAGNAYVAGVSGSVDFPTTPGALQTGAASPSESFAAKYNPLGQLVYATYLAGIGASAIAVDNQGAAYLAGQGMPGSNPTMKSVRFGPPPPNSPSGTAAKLHPAGCALVYSAFLGGNWGAFGTAITVDSSGDAFVGGGTISADFPTVNPVQASCHACSGGNQTASPFITKLDPTGTSLMYSTFLGGGDNPSHLCCNKATGIAIDLAGNAYIAGQTLSSDFPTTNAVQSQYGGQIDAFVAKISPAIVPSLSISPAYLSFSPQAVGTTSAPQTVTVTNQTTNRVNISSISTYELNPQYTEADTCATGLGPGASCTIAVTFAPTESGTLSRILTVNDDAYGGPHVVGLMGDAITGPQVVILGLSGGSDSTWVGNTFVGTTVGPSPVTAENLGESPLIVTRVATTGDFSQTNNCTTLAFRDLCTINISFTPTAPGDRTGTLTITDNAPDSPQVVTLLGGGEEFSLAASQASTSVTAGQSATYTINLTPVGGFNQQITLTCTGAPQRSTCSVSPNPVTLNGVNVGSVTITVTTTAPSFAFPAQRSIPPRWTPRLPQALALLALFLALVVAVVSRRRLEVAVVAALMLATLWASCGGSGGGGGENLGTPSGTYTLTVSGMSGSLSHTLNLTLNVN